MKNPDFFERHPVWGGIVFAAAMASIFVGLIVFGFVFRGAV